MFSSSVFVPLRVRDYRFLLTSNFFWWQVRWMESIVTGWLVFELTDSAWMVALTAFYRSIPFLVVGLFSGTIIDRFGRRNCILVAQTVNLLINLSLAALLWHGQLALWHIFAAALLMGTVWSVDWPARRSLIPDLVGKEHTVDGMILENVVQNLSAVFGPFVGGLFIEILGITGAFTFMALTALTAWLALRGISRQPIPRLNMPTAESPWARIISVLRYGRRNPSILGVMWITVIMNFLAFPYLDLLPVFAREVLNQGPIGLGLLGGANGIGAFVGLFLISRIRHRVNNGLIFLVGCTLQSAVLIFFAMSELFVLSLALLIVGGIGRACFGVMQTSLILLNASDEMRSRAMGSLTLFIGIGPFGRLQMGGMAERFGAPLAVGVHGALGVVALLLLGLFVPGMWRTRSEQEPSATEFQ